MLEKNFKIPYLQHDIIQGANLSDIILSLEVFFLLILELTFQSKARILSLNINICPCFYIYFGEVCQLLLINKLIS